MKFSIDKCRLVWTGKWENDYYCVVDFKKSYPGGTDGVFDGQRLYFTKKKENSCLLMKLDELELVPKHWNKLADHVVSGVIDDENSILYQHNHLGCLVRVRVSGKEVDGRLCWCGTVNGAQFIVTKLNQSLLQSNEDIFEVYYFSQEKAGYYHLVPVSDIVTMNCRHVSKQTSDSSAPPPYHHVELAGCSTKIVNQNKSNYQNRTNNSFVFCDWTEKRLQLRSWMRIDGYNCRLVWTGKRGDEFYFVVEFLKSYPGGTDGVFDGQRLYHGKKENSCLLVKPDELEVVEEHWGNLPDNVISCSVDDENSLLYDNHLGCLVRVRVLLDKEISGNLRWCGTVDGVYHVVVELEQGMDCDSRFLHKMFYFNLREENLFILLPIQNVISINCSSQSNKMNDQLTTPSFQATDSQVRLLVKTEKTILPDVQRVPPKDNNGQNSSKSKLSNNSSGGDHQHKLTSSQEQEINIHQNDQHKINEEDLFILSNLPQSKLQIGSRVYYGELCGQLVWTGKRGQDWFVVIDFDDFVVDGTDGTFDNQRLYHSTRTDSCLLLKPEQMKPSRTAFEMSINTKTCAVADENSLLCRTHLGCAVRVRLLEKEIKGRLCWCGTVDGSYCVVVELTESITLENNDWPKVFYSLNEVDTYVLLPVSDVLWIECTPPAINKTQISPHHNFHTELDYHKFVYCDLPKTSRFYKLLLGSLLKYQNRHCNLVWTGKRDSQFFVLLDFGSSIINGNDGMVDGQRLYHATKADSCLLVPFDHQHLHRNSLDVLPANAISCSVDDRNSILYQHYHLGCDVRVRVSGIEVKGRLCWCGTVDGSPFVVVDLECSRPNAEMLWKKYFVGSSGHHYAVLPSNAVIMKECFFGQ